MWEMGLQVIQAKRLVEQEKMSSNAFHQGVQSLSDPFASKLAHLLCFNFDELYDLDSPEELCSDPIHEVYPWYQDLWQLVEAAAAWPVVQLFVQFLAALPGAACAVRPARAVSVAAAVACAKSEQQLDLAKQLDDLVELLKEDEKLQGLHCSQLGAATMLVQMKYHGDVLSEKDLLKVGNKAKANLSDALRKSLKVYKQSESSESDTLVTPIPMMVVGYSQGSVIVWILLGVAAGVVAILGALSWWRYQDSSETAEQDSEHMSTEIRARADILRRRAAPAVIPASSASPTVPVRSSFGRTPRNGQEGLQEIEVEEHEREIARLQSFSEDMHMPRARLLRREWSATDLVTQIRTQFPNHTTDKELTKFLMDSRVDFATAVQNETSDSNLTEVLQHYVTLFFVGLVAVKDYHGVQEWSRRNRVSFTANRTLASTIGQVNPRFERLQVLSKLGQELFLIGRDFATTPSHLQRVKVELDAFLDAEPRVLDILGRRRQFVDEYPYLLELVIEARNSLNVLVEKLASSKPGLVERFSPLAFEGAARESGAMLIRLFFRTCLRPFVGAW